MKLWIQTILMFAIVVVLGFLLFKNNPPVPSTQPVEKAWTSEIMDWNGGKILKVGYADPILGTQYHYVPWVPVQETPSK